MICSNFLLFILTANVLVLEITCWCWCILSITKDTPVFNQVYLDEVSLSLVNCPVCYSDIEFSVLWDSSKDYDAITMVWPPRFCNLCLAELYVEVLFLVFAKFCFLFIHSMIDW